MVEISGERPWETIDSKSYIFGSDGRWVKGDFSTYDSPEQIELCLRCPIADECMDCVAAKTVSRRTAWKWKRLGRSKRK